MNACRIKILLIGIFVSLNCFAEDFEPTASSNVNFISPYYFGPNACPVPDMVDEMSKTLKIQLAGDFYKGDRKDKTYDLFLKADIPLFTPHVNLSLWMPVMEWYKNSTENINACGIEPQYRETAKQGHLSGDVYVATNILLLQENKITPIWTLRAALKTASGGEYDIRRYYDCAGYFFDTTIAKKFTFSSLPSLWLRFALSGGFLCWQTDISKQNDAIMYGAKLALGYSNISLTGEFGGYSGWQHAPKHEGALVYDQPSRFKIDLSWKIKDFSIGAGLCIGVKDYPYKRFQVGVIYDIDILKSK